MGRNIYKETGMRILTVVGISSSGKTTVVENLILELKSRGYSVGTVKSISCGTRCKLMMSGVCKCSGGGNHHGFTIDTSGKNSSRHRKAGSMQVTTWAEKETAVMYQRELSYEELVALYDYDYLILEGDYFNFAPRIVTGKTEDDAAERITPMTIAVSGCVANEINTLSGLPAINVLEDAATLADLVIEKTFPKLPNVEKSQCGKCGFSCKELSERIIKGESKFTDCIYTSDNTVCISLDGEEIELTLEEQERLLKTVSLILRDKNVSPAIKNISLSCRSGR